MHSVWLILGSRAATTRPGLACGCAAVVLSRRQEAVAQPMTMTGSIKDCGDTLLVLVLKRPAGACRSEPPSSKTVHTRARCALDHIVKLNLPTWEV